MNYTYTGRSDADSNASNEEDNTPSANTSKYAQYKCNTCNKLGHIAKHCTMKKSAKKSSHVTLATAREAFTNRDERFDSVECGYLPRSSHSTVATMMLDDREIDPDDAEIEVSSEGDDDYVILLDNASNLT